MKDFSAPKESNNAKPVWLDGLELESRAPLKESKPSLLVIDDDPLFCERMARTALAGGARITCCKTVGEVLQLSRSEPLEHFDVAIVDYFFGELTAVQVSFLLGNMPVFLMSESERTQITQEPWPIDVKGFLHKSLGTDAILRHALASAGMTAHLPPPAASFRETASYWGPLAWFAAWLILAAGLFVNRPGPTTPSPAETLGPSWRWDRAFDPGTKTSSNEAVEKDDGGATAMNEL